MPISVSSPSTSYPYGSAGLTLSQLRTLVKRYGFDDNDPVDSWIQEAIYEVEDAASWTFLEVSDSSLSGSVNERLISLPIEFVKPYSLWDKTHGCKLRYTDPRMFDFEIPDPTVTGQPELYTLHGLSEIQFYPSLVETTDFVLRYKFSIPVLTDANTKPLLPPRLHYAVVYKAAAIGWMAENEEERAGKLEVQWERRMQSAFDNYAAREEDFDEGVVDTAGYGDQ